MTHEEKVINITKTLRYVFKYSNYAIIKSFRIEYNSENRIYTLLNPSVPIESKNLTTIVRQLIKKMTK
jgi:hypothetical protein